MKTSGLQSHGYITDVSKEYFASPFISHKHYYLSSLHALQYHIKVIGDTMTLNILRSVLPIYGCNITTLNSTQPSQQGRKTLFIWTLVIRIVNHPDLLSPSGKFVENSTKPTWLEITSYWIKYSTVLWLLELQIRRGRKV